MPAETYFSDGLFYRKATQLWVATGTSNVSDWKPLVSLHVWDGSSWQLIYASLDLVSAFGSVINAFSWDLTYSLNTTAPTGYQLSVKLGFLEAGPFDVGGTSGGTINVTTDSSGTYNVQLLTDASAPFGTTISVTPS